MAKIRLASVLMIGIALVISLAVGYFAYTRVQKASRVNVKSLETRTIAVAKFDFSSGTLLQKNMIKMAPFQKDSLPSGYFNKESMLDGRVLIQPLKANMPLIESMLAPTTVKAGGVAAIVSLQKRAMSVKVDRVIGVSGYIAPEHRVDVLVTVSYKEKESVLPVTKTILENIRVLAVGSEVDDKEKKGKPISVDVVTLEVTPEEGEKLALASTQGKIQLALRNYVDAEDVLTRGVTIPNLISS
ncbi:MAG TPA: Flp pilus assembly protein CpaB, partial [Candidatus Brocadiaceae bacterium]